jgi:uncharacterized protein YqeY
MSTSDLQGALRIALTQALSSRDLVAASALRSALSAIANAEAIAPAETASKRPNSEHFAGAMAGLGAAEAARRELTEADIAAIVSAEVSDRLSAADAYDRLDRADQSMRLRREADVLAALLTGQD